MVCNKSCDHPTEKVIVDETFDLTSQRIRVLELVISLLMIFRGYNYKNGNKFKIERKPEKIVPGSELELEDVPRWKNASHFMLYALVLFGFYDSSIAQHTQPQIASLYQVSRRERASLRSVRCSKKEKRDGRQLSSLSRCLFDG